MNRAVNRIIEADPAVADGVMRANSYPYNIVLMRPQTEKRS